VPDQLILKRASASRPSGKWQDDDYDVLADGIVVGRIYDRALGSIPPERRWFWSILEIIPDIKTTHGYEPTREAAMAAFAKSWRRE
jgi:hypothetical protein